MYFACTFFRVSMIESLLYVRRVCMMIESMLSLCLGLMFTFGCKFLEFLSRINACEILFGFFQDFSD